MQSLRPDGNSSEGKHSKVSRLWMLQGSILCSFVLFRWFVFAFTLTGPLLAVCVYSHSIQVMSSVWQEMEKTPRQTRCCLRLPGIK